MIVIFISLRLIFPFSYLDIILRIILFYNSFITKATFSLFQVVHLFKLYFITLFQLKKWFLIVNNTDILIKLIVQLLCSKLPQAISCFHNWGPSRVSRRRAAEAPSRIFPRPSYSPFTALQDAFDVYHISGAWCDFWSTFDPELERAHQCLKALLYRRSCAKRPALLSLCGCVSVRQVFHRCSWCDVLSPVCCRSVCSCWHTVCDHIQATEQTASGPKGGEEKKLEFCLEERIGTDRCVQVELCVCVGKRETLLRCSLRGSSIVHVMGEKNLVFGVCANEGEHRNRPSAASVLLAPLGDNEQFTV